MRNIVNLLAPISPNKNITAKKVIHQIYANYDASVMFLGRLDNAYCSYFLYAFECKLNEKNVDKVSSYIAKRQLKPPFYVCPWGVVKKIDNPQLEGYCKLPISEPHYDSSLYQRIQSEIKSETEKINTLPPHSSLKNLLTEYANLQPNVCSQYEIDQYAILSDTLSFLKQYDFLLLSDDEEIRNTYHTYLEKAENFRCYRMNYER